MGNQSAAGRPVVLLIASKHDWTSRSLESILSPRGWLVWKTFTRVEALNLAAREAPDAVIVDVQLSDGDGHALCRALRTRGLVSPSTPVLLTIPQSPTRRDRLAALRAGAWECLGEPHDAEEVLAILDALIPAKLDAEQARTEGLVDEATGLYNLRGITRRAYELASYASRHHVPLACVMLAPDLSPEAAGEDPSGDEHAMVQRRAVAALKSAGRLSDAIGRVGPNVFGVVALDADPGQTRVLAERLAEALLSPSENSPAEPARSLRLRAGCHTAADIPSAPIDSVELMLGATAALHKAQADPAGAWLRCFDETEPPRASG